MNDRSTNILAIDQGTTNTKVLLVDGQGVVIAQASRPLTQSYPHPAWVEQDADAIWQSVRLAIDDCLAAVGEPRLAAIAITNQRESVTLWERSSGRPLGPVVVWQCRRTADFCADLRGRGLAPWLAERTGLAIDPLFSASKMRWLLDHAEEGQRRAERGELCLGTIDSWVLWNLTGGAVHATDLTNASRTQLLDIHTRNWSAELLDVFGVPQAALPDVKPSRANFGTSAAIGRLPAGIPIASLIGDSHAALFGQAGFVPGTVKATYGTGSSLMTPTLAPVMSKHGLSTTIAWALDRDHVTYALEGNIPVTGAAVQWLAEFLSLPSSAAVAELAERASDSAGLYVVPAFVGLGAPYWNDAARGLVSGLTRGSTAAHLARATIEAIAYQVRDVFDVMRAEAGTELKVLLADGGASQNGMLMQFQADIIGRPVLRNQSADASALGAAYLAGLASGIWQTLAQIEDLPRLREQFEPQMSMEERATRAMGWKTAIARVTLGTE
jgi:glycerol kinase